MDADDEYAEDEFDYEDEDADDDDDEDEDDEDRQGEARGGEVIRPLNSCICILTRALQDLAFSEYLFNFEYSVAILLISIIQYPNPNKIKIQIKHLYNSGIKCILVNSHILSSITFVQIYIIWLIISRYTCNQLVISSNHASTIIV